VILKLTAIITFMLGAIFGVFWIVLELAGAVTEGSDWVWYLALALTIVPAILFLVVAARARTRAVVAFTAVAALLVVGVALTYPTDKAACGPDSGQTANGNGPSDGLDNGALVDDGDIQVDEEDTTTTADC